MKREILLIFLCIVMIMSTLSLCACDDRWKEYTYDEFYCAWMKDIADDTLIKDIVIPGAHDAGTKGMIWMAETQDSSIMTQLKLGVRYFDLRVNKSKDNLVMFHSIIDGQNFLDVMSDITTFMETNTTELLILDFQHFKGESQADVSRLLTEKLDGKMVINNTNLPNLDFVDQLSLGKCRGKCLVTFGDNYNSVNSNYIFPRNNDYGTLEGCVLDSYYASDLNKLNTNEYILTALPQYYAKAEIKNKGLFVLQGQLTAPILIDSLANLESNHSNNMNEYITSLRSNTALLSLTNIIIRDFVEQDKISNIISLNYFNNALKSSAMKDWSNKLGL